MKLVCVCDDWEESMGQIIDAQVFCALHDMEYTGKPFVFCPWCGDMLMVEGSTKHRVALLGKSILRFRIAAVDALRKMKDV